MMSKTKNN